MKCNAQGLVSDVEFIASPNYDQRPPNTKITLLVIHNISLPPGQFSSNAIIDFFTNKLVITEHPYYQTLKELKVSAHFLIRRDGHIIQFVPCELRAWHAGVSSWKGKECCNDFSIGIELEGTDNTFFTDPQYENLIRLTESLFNQYPIYDVVGHADIAPNRKTDPGVCFDWSRYRNALKNFSRKNFL